MSEFAHSEPSESREAINLLNQYSLEFRNGISEIKGELSAINIRSNERKLAFETALDLIREKSDEALNVSQNLSKVVNETKNHISVLTDKVSTMFKNYEDVYKNSTNTLNEIKSLSSTMHQIVDEHADLRNKVEDLRLRESSEHGKQDAKLYMLKVLGEIAKVIIPLAGGITIAKYL